MVKTSLRMRIPRATSTLVLFDVAVRFGPSEMPGQGLKRRLAVDFVAAEKEFDLGPFGNAEPGVQAADLGVFRRDPFVRGHRVVVASLDHERAWRDQRG